MAQPGGQPRARRREVLGVQPGVRDDLQRLGEALHRGVDLARVEQTNPVGQVDLGRGVGVPEVAPDLHGHESLGDAADAGPGPGAQRDAGRRGVADGGGGVVEVPRPPRVPTPAAPRR